MIEPPQNGEFAEATKASHQTRRVMHVLSDLAPDKSIATCSVCGPGAPTRTITERGRAGVVRCATNHKKWQPSSVESCDIEGCDRLQTKRGLCGKHYHRVKRYGDPLYRIKSERTPAERFWDMVQKEACWTFIGALNPGGYGVTHDGVRARIAHRYAYELLVGPIPDGLTLDHLCHTRSETCEGGPICPHRACVNPDHLEPVASGENTLRGLGPAALNARKSTCVNGHPFDEANTRIDKDGYRVCKTCARENGRRYDAARRAA